MLVKWIRCTVTDRRGFERGQRKWAGLPGEPGFRGQGGGWSRGRQGVAHVFAFWENRVFYALAEPFFLPLEFSVAAYRFGHSMARAAYDFFLFNTK